MGMTTSSQRAGPASWMKQPGRDAIWYGQTAATRERKSRIMSTRQPQNAPAAEETQAERPLSDAAKRALAEAEERRRQAAAAQRPRELGGRDGPEPTRYGDWEKGGIVSDF
jgi:hypothetical protein